MKKDHLENILNLTSMKDLLNPDEIQKIVILKKLARNWESLVGPVLSEHSMPKLFQSNALVIETNHSAYSQEILFQSQKIIDFIHKHSHFKSIKTIRCNIGKLPFQTKKKVNSRKPSLVGKDSLILSLEKIKDEELKKKLLSIIEVME